MSDLVERLRTRNGRPDGFGIGPVCDEAADRIAELEKDRDYLEKTGTKHLQRMKTSRR